MWWTTAAGDGVGLAERARAAGASIVIAAGGDGTAHEVVNGLLAGGLEGVPRFAYLPLGSGCDFARSLGLGNAGEIAARLPAAALRHVDLGRIDLVAPSGRQHGEYFLNAVNVGLAPLVLRRVRESSWLGGLRAAAYPVASALELFSAAPVDLSLRRDGKITRRGAALNLSVCNGATFGGGMRPCPAAEIDSGRLDVAWVKPLGVFSSLLQLRRLMRGTGVNHQAVELTYGQQFDLEGLDLEVEVDGEIPGRLPARISVLPGRLEVLSP